MGVRRKLIKELVEDLLEKKRIRQAPVDVEKIVRSYHIAMQLDKVDSDLSGFLFRDEKAKRVVIGANIAHHPNRQRFTLAHELGHYLLHDGERVHLDEAQVAYKINHRDLRSSEGEDDEEKEANFFAAELLMPEKFLSRDLESIDLDLLDDDEVFLDNLARKYRVSAQALTFRLANLGYIKL